MTWTPDMGDAVWMNHPDGGMLGRVVGFVADGEHRAGQPIIEAPKDEPGMLGKKKGDRFAIHPMFLLPFRYGGAAWQRANAEGRIR